MPRSSKHRDDDPFRPEPAGRRGLRLAAASTLLAGAGCCVYWMPAAGADTDMPVMLGQVAGAAGALGCLAVAAILFAWEW